MDKDKRQLSSIGVMSTYYFIEIIIFSLSFLCVYSLKNIFDLAVLLILFYIIFILVTIFFIRILILFLPLKEGVYVYRIGSLRFAIWQTYALLCATNLWAILANSIIPAIYISYFYRLLGMKTRGGFISIGGKIYNHFLVSLGENVTIGMDVLILGHIVLVPGTILLGKIKIEKEVVIGVKSVIMPGVTVGENSIVNALSVVTTGTKIPPNEIWGGNPAKKIRDA